MTLTNWEKDEATRLVARDLAGAAVVDHLGAGRDVVMAQYFGRLGYLVLLEDLARVHGATFVEVILATGAALAIERFRARRRAMTERDERHPERDIADGDVEAFILDAVDRLTRLPTARPESRIVPVALRGVRRRDLPPPALGSRREGPAFASLVVASGAEIPVCARCSSSADSGAMLSSGWGQPTFLTNRRISVAHASGSSTTHAWPSFGSTTSCDVAIAA